MSCAVRYRISSVTGLDGDRIKGTAVGDLVAHLLHAAHKNRGVAGYALCDALEALGTVVHGKHAGQYGRQHLRGTDVGGGFFAANVLLAGLQRQPIGRVTVRVHTHAHQTAWHGAFEFVAACQIGRVRATVAQGHAKALGGAQGYVGTQLAGGRQQGERQQIRSHDDHATPGFVLGNEVLKVAHHTTHAGVLQQHGKAVLRQCIFPAANLDRDAQGLGAGLDDFQRLGQHININQQGGRFRLAYAQRQRHGLGCRRGFVQHGSIGHGHAGEVAYHGLKIDQRFHATLADFGLVRRVGGVPGWVFQDVAQDDARRVGVKVTLADEALENLVL